MNDASIEFNTRLELDVMVNGLTEIDHEYVRQFAVPLYNLHKLTDVIIPEGITRINRSAFEGLINLTNITIPDSVTIIEEWAFAWCEGLTNITIPGSVTWIGDSAFRYCRGLASVSIGNGEATIGGCAFEGCHRLTKLMIEGKAGDKVKRQQLIGIFSQKIKCTDLVDFEIITT